MNTIEPPVLMSRIMTFVFAAAFATVVVLVLSISNLLPLNRTQVFFLTTSPRENMEITVTPYAPNDTNMEIFRENFIKEYIKLRNEVIPNIQVMRRKWEAGSSGAVYIMSALPVFADFLETGMVSVIMSDITEFRRRCPVEFIARPTLLSRNSDGSFTYEVRFRYYCDDADAIGHDNTGQTAKKDYTIHLTIGFRETIKWATRLDNPLGLYVSEYRVIGGSDPLNFGF